jgi:hypothetical protein
MFPSYCTNCRSKVLLGPRRIVAMESSDACHQVALRCFCGHIVRAAVQANVRDQRELRGAA